ncbi:hypothetical protein LNP74_32085 [Klebsiella pneumoniae subsp. pneumoniae]|nr:hypothetical protein [Klebsiella pneumoniae subsp. pneumoniae]
MSKMMHDQPSAAVPSFRTGAIFDRRRRSGFGRNHPWQERRRDGETGWSDMPNAPFGCCSRPEGETLNHANSARWRCPAWDPGACRWWVITAEVRAIVKPWLRLSGQPSNKVSRS